MTDSLKYHRIAIQNVEGDCGLLMIYTGGTLGMQKDPHSGLLLPFSFRQIRDFIPELEDFKCPIDVITLDTLVDSADMKPEIWVGLAEIIRENYKRYNGFVILHGTDTMAYSASALSFLLEGITKPVVFTGAQLPIGVPRNDARANVLTSLEIAAQKEGGEALVQEVVIYFNGLLLRGNRAKKVESTHFDAFKTENYPVLAHAGVTIEYNKKALYRNSTTSLKTHRKMDANVMVVRLFPGLSEGLLNKLLFNDEVEGLIIESFGAGNMYSDDWFIKLLRELSDKNVPVLNVSQCESGRVLSGIYSSSAAFEENGVVNGADMTIEAAVTKMQFLCSNYSTHEIKHWLQKSISGELTETST